MVDVKPAQCFLDMPLICCFAIYGHIASLAGVFAHQAAHILVAHAWGPGHHVLLELLVRYAHVLVDRNINTGI